MQIADLIDRYDAALNTQDLDVVALLHDGEIVFENHTAGERADGTATARDHIGRFFERWPTLRFERRWLCCSEDFAVTEWTERTTHPDDDRWLKWGSADAFPITAVRLVARKDVYSTSATSRVLSS